MVLITEIKTLSLGIGEDVMTIMPQHGKGYCFCERGSSGGYLALGSPAQGKLRPRPLSFTLRVYMKSSSANKKLTTLRTAEVVSKIFH